MPELAVDGRLRWGLSISSGGAKVAWAFGFLLAAIEKAPSFLSHLRLSIGSSAGAVASAAVGHAVIERSNWPLIRAHEAILRMCEYGLDERHLEDMLHECLPNEVCFALISQAHDKHLPFEVAACAVNTRTLTGELFSTRDPWTPEQIRQILLASSAIPGVIEPVRIVAHGDTYLDGGFSDLNPSGFLSQTPSLANVQGLIRLQYTHGPCEVKDHVSAFLEPPSVGTRALTYATNAATKRYLGVEAPDNLASALVRLAGQVFRRPEAEKISESVGRQSARVRIAMPCVTFRPSRPISIGALDFDRDRIRATLDLGYSDGMKTFHWRT